MEVVRSPARMRMIAQKLRSSNQHISLVPTSGNLHAGHFELVRSARSLSEVVVVSILPVPTTLSLDQAAGRPFLARDAEQLAPLDPGYLFAPEAKDLISPTISTEVSVRPLGDRLYGALRPGHYAQKATVLVMLFNLVNPNYLHLGEKDIQEQVIARRVIQDLGYDIEVLISRTMREEDGVAFGAELQWMSTEERRAASVFYRALERAQVLFGAGQRDAAGLIKSVREVIETESLARVDFLSVVDGDSLETVTVIDEQPVVLAGAVHIGEVRLIDNIWLNQ